MYPAHRLISKLRLAMHIEDLVYAWCTIKGGDFTRHCTEVMFHTYTVHTLHLFAVSGFNGACCQHLNIILQEIGNNLAGFCILFAGSFQI